MTTECRHTRWLFILKVAAFVAVCGVVLWCESLLFDNSEEPRNKAVARTNPTLAHPTQDLPKWVVRADQLVAKYPYLSLNDRLAYEIEQPTGKPKPARPVKVSEATWNRLERLENLLAKTQLGDLRTESLKMLHSKQVVQFIERDGAGYARMEPPSPKYLELPAVRPIPLLGGWSTADSEGEGPLARAEHPALLPSTYVLERFHRNGQLNFVNPNSFGHIVNRAYVAGFESHHFSRLPSMADEGQETQNLGMEKEPWVVHRLELVSLLKHKTPAAYISEFLPRMDELKKAKTRPLTSFEKRALRGLQGGEDLVTEASDDRIWMMGSLRAAKQCLDCHHARRGDLLGTFSYQLRRVSPVEGGR